MKKTSVHAAEQGLIGPQLGVFIAACLALIIALFARPGLTEPTKYTLDPEHLTVGFLIDHIGFAKTLGIFRDVSGSFVFDEESNAITDVEVIVKTGSVDTFHERRDDHVKSKDFLNVEQFPEMVFSNLRAEADGPDSGRITGDLTLLGVTQPIELTVERNKSAPYPFGSNPPNTLGLSLRGQIKRSDFGMTYGVDNGLVGDIVDLIIEVEANASS